MSTLPAPGLQSILLLLCVGAWSLNRLCALAMVPLTWPPLVPGLCVLVGYRLRHGDWLTEFSVRTLGHEAGQRLWEWVLGSLCMAPVLGLLAGAAVWLLARMACRLPSGGEKRRGSDGNGRRRGVKWSGKSLGSRFQHQIFYRLIRCGATGPARVLLRAVVLYYTLLPGVRRRCRPYLQRRFPGARGIAALLHAYRLYLAFGQVLLDRSIAGITGRFAVRHTSATRELLRRVLAEEKGCIILSAHMGAWQMGLAGLEELRRPVHVVQRRNAGDVDRHYFEHGGEHAVSVIDSTRPLEAFVEIAAALRRKEVVCLMGDRLTDADAAAVRVPFLGGPVAVPVTAYALASITGAPLVVTFAVREEGETQGVWGDVLRVPPGLRRDPERLRPFAVRFAAALEDMVRRYPYQFFNFYDMWGGDDDATGTDGGSEAGHCEGTQPGRRDAGKHRG